MFVQFCSICLLLIFLVINCIKTSGNNSSMYKNLDSPSLLKPETLKALQKRNCKKDFKEFVHKTNELQGNINHFNVAESLIGLTNKSYNKTGKTGLPEIQNNTQHCLRRRSLVDKKRFNSYDMKENRNITFDEKAREDAYRKTEATEYPYAVGILIRTEENMKWSQICSGTLLTLEWVLTAAHCVPPETILVKVYAGVFNMTEAFIRELIGGGIPEGSQAITSDQVYPHPDYDEDHNANDVGLIRLTGGGFNATDYARPITLSTQPWTHRGYLNCVVTAYGSVLQGERHPDDYVRKTQVVEAKKPCLCAFRFGQIFESKADDRYICNRPKLDYGVCQGDSGSALVCDGQVQAVASLVLTLTNVWMCKFIMLPFAPPLSGMECGGSDSLSVYTDTCPFLHWINSQVRLFNESEIALDCQVTAGCGKNRCRWHLVLCVILVFFLQFIR